MDQVLQALPLRRRVRRELALAAPRLRRPARRLRLTAVAVLLWGFASGPAVAQPPYVQELAPGFSSLDAGLHASVKLADLDGDGDLDVVVGEYGGSLRFFENTGSSAAPAFAEQTGSSHPLAGFDVGARSQPELVDLDGDSDLDAVVGDELGTLSYFENTGSSLAPAFQLASANPLGMVDVGFHSSPELVDLDGDADLDAVVGEFAGGHRYFENTGSMLVPAFVERTGSANPLVAIVVSSRSRPELVDLDGDADLDAVVGEISGAVRYFTNTGSSSAAAFVESTESANPFDGIDVGGYSDLALADLDGDGDLDALVGESYGSLRVVTNTGSSTAPAFLATTGTANPLAGLDVGAYSQPELVDLDGDSDLDAVVGESDGRLRYFANTGAATLPVFVERTGTANPLSGVNLDIRSSAKLADLDGDSDLDAVVGEDYGGLSYFANTGSSSAPAFVQRTGTANPFNVVGLNRLYSPELVDLDGDSDLDLVLGNLYGVLRYYANTGSSSAPAFVQRTGTANPFSVIDVGYDSSPVLADLDEDGDLDLVLGHLYGGLRAFANTGSSSLPAFAELSGSANPFAAVAVGSYSSSGPDLVDLDGDGDLDAIVGELGGHLIVYRSRFAVFSDGFESGDVSAWSAVVP